MCQTDHPPAPEGHGPDTHGPDAQGLQGDGRDLTFAAPGSPAEIEEGDVFMPRFDRDGLITCIAVDAGDGRLLMVAHMNAQSLARTLETGEVWYWSRSRRQLWRKGATSGQTQRVVEMRTDCDQDALLITVAVGGDGGCCHTGRRSCFYRTVSLDPYTRQARLAPAGE